MEYARNELGCMCIDGGKMFMWFLRKWNMKLGAGFVWLIRGPTGRLL
jgi:hypothetical protein